MIRSAIFAIAGLLMVYGCTRGDGLGFENSLRFYGKEQQALFIKRLEQRNVPFLVAPDESVRYQASDEAIVSKIKNEVLKESFKPSMKYEDPEMERRVTDNLTAAGIPYEIEIRGGQRWIQWDDQYDQRVIAIARSTPLPGDDEPKKAVDQWPPSPRNGS